MRAPAFFKNELHLYAQTREQAEVVASRLLDGVVRSRSRSVAAGPVCLPKTRWARAKPFLVAFVVGLAVAAIGSAGMLAILGVPR